MVIYEKALVRCMKEAHKGGGYTVAVTDRVGTEEVLISGPGWLTMMLKEVVPWKVLGLLVEHLGRLPVAGEAFSVNKSQTQIQLIDVVLDQLLEIRSQEKGLTTARMTSLTFQGCQIWQSMESQTVLMMDPDLGVLLMPKNRPVRMIGKEKLMVDGDRSRVYIDAKRDRHKPADKVLEFLSGMVWKVD